MWASFPILPLAFLWFFVIDSPHVVATATRTYFDKDERRKLGWLLWIPLPLVLVGPAMAFAGRATIFFTLAFCWQQFHVTKQHFGFIMLYKAKNNEFDSYDRKLDRWFLLASLFVPLAWFVLHLEPELEGWLHSSRAFAWTERTVLAIYALLCTAWLTRQAQKWRAGKEMNWPKVWLLAGVVPLQWMAFLYAAPLGRSGFLQAGIPLGIFHGLQYHRLLWFHNHNKYGAPEAAERNGLAAVLARKSWRYVAAAIVLNLVLEALPQALFPYKAMQAALWGIPFTHYVLDSKIWRVRGNRELADALHMN